MSSVEQTVEIYFCIVLTADEHDIVADIFDQECKKHGCKLQYYRQLKDGHVPTYREVKIVGQPPGIYKMQNYIHKNYRPHLERNPHKCHQ